MKEIDDFWNLFDIWFNYKINSIISDVKFFTFNEFVEFRNEKIESTKDDFYNSGYNVIENNVYGYRFLKIENFTVERY